MAKTIRTYIGEAGRTLYPIDFNMGYLDKSNIYVYSGDDYNIQLSYTWVNSNQIQLAAPFTVGVPFVIRRIVTRVDTTNNYEDGAILSERNLDDSFKQAIMVLEELEDGFITLDDTIWFIKNNIQVSGYLDMNGSRLLNLPLPLEYNEPVIKSQLDQVYVDLASYSSSSQLAAALAGGTANVGGVTSGELAKRFSSEAYLVDFIPDGFTGDVAPFIEEILETYDTLVITSGDYLINTPAIISDNYKCINLHAGARIYYTQPTLTPITFTGDFCGVFGQGTVQGPAVFDGENVAPQYAMIKFLGDGNYVDGIKIKTIPKIGVWFNEANSGRITNCRIDGATTDTFFDGTNTVHAGVYIDPTSTGSQGNYIISTNEIKRTVQGVLAANLGSASNETSYICSGNVFELCWNHGYYTSGLGNGHNVSSNTFNSCQIPVALTGRNHVVSNNTMIVQTVATTNNDVEITGISLRNPQSCIVSNNTIKGSGTNGGVVIDLQYNPLVPGEADVIDNIVSGNVIFVNNNSLAGVAAIRITSSASLLSRNIITGNTLRAPLRAQAGLIEVSGSSSFYNIDNKVTNNIVTSEGALGESFIVLLSNIAESEVKDNILRIAFNASTATVIWMVALSGSSYNIVEKNTLVCASTFGDNLNLRALSELGTCNYNIFTDNLLRIDEAQLDAYNRFIFSPSSNVVLKHTGLGSPEGAVIGSVGSTWTRSDGGAGTTLYVKESGTSNTGWIGK